MKSYTLTFTEEIYQSVKEHLWKDGNESAGYLFAKQCKTDSEIRLIVREFCPVECSDILEASPLHLSINSSSFVRALKHADDAKECFIFVHSHPKDQKNFSRQDDNEERILFSCAYNRIHHNGVHASLIFPKESAPKGRVWLEDGSNIPITRIRIIGNRFQFFDNCDSGGEDDNLEHFDRQVRAFGKEGQKVLSGLHIAIVGCGGTGSAVAEQLARLGVGSLSLYDGDTFDKTNVNRVYGSTLKDQGLKKTEIVKRTIESIGLGTAVKTYGFIRDKETGMSLRSADIVFGCTDDEFGRSVLNELAIRYFIPVIDMGVKISSNGGIVTSIFSRVTVLTPGSACLFCREHITPEKISAEVQQIFYPKEAEARRKEGYAPELEEKAPSVIAFTTAAASTSVTELLQRLFGFMGSDRSTSEILSNISLEKTIHNSRKPMKDCKCASKKTLGVADTKDYLGMIWP